MQTKFTLSIEKKQNETELEFTNQNRVDEKSMFHIPSPVFNTPFLFKLFIWQHSVLISPIVSLYKLASCQLRHDNIFIILKKSILYVKRLSYKEFTDSQS